MNAMTTTFKHFKSGTVASVMKITVYILNNKFFIDLLPANVSYFSQIIACTIMSACHITTKIPSCILKGN